MYKEAFTKVADVLRNHPYININELVINDPATPELIDSFEMIAGIRLPETIKDFYLFANGIKCVWSVKNNLPSAIMDKIRAEGEQLDFDYSKPLGAVNIAAIQDMLLDKYWEVPFQKPPESDQKIEFSGHSLPLGAFAKKLKLFDAYGINNDAEGMALLTDLPIEGDPFHLILLDNYLADWNQTNIIDFETYMLSICETRFTIPSRKRLFAKKNTGPPIVINNENIIREQLIPSLFRQITFI